MSKLSYFGKRSESRENARASGEAARGAQTGELTRRLARGTTQLYIRLAWTSAFKQFLP